MLEQPLARIEQYENVQEYMARGRARQWRLLFCMVALLVVAFSIYVLIRTFAPKALPYAPILALSSVLFMALPVLIWNNPRIGLYILVFSVTLFNQFPAGMYRDPFNYVPLFWNISTAVDHFAGSRALGSVNFNIGELIMVMTIVFWLVRQVVLREFKFQKGEFFGWLGLYILWVGFGFLRGMQNGGNITFALWEMRAQCYFFLAYLMAVNLVTDRKHVNTLLWLMVLGIGAKSIVGTINWIKNPDVSADEGVLSHEDSLLMNLILFGAITLFLGRADPKLKWAFLLFVPTAIATSLANGRRAGIAAFIVAFPVVIAMSAVLLRERRKQLIAFMGFFLIAAAVYLPIAWNGRGAWALPARAIKSRTQPDERDAGSNYYRLAENNNLKQTRDSSPWLGYGYGRPFFNTYAMPGREDQFKQILPHNGILWIWMRLGHIGFVFFWMFVATVLLRGPMLLHKIRDPRLQAFGILAIANFLMAIIYGEYDLCFANYRVMWLAGTLLGIMAALPHIVALKRDERTAAGQTFAGQGKDDDLDVRDVDDKDTPNTPGAGWRPPLPGQRDTPNLRPELPW